MRVFVAGALLVLFAPSGGPSTRLGAGWTTLKMGDEPVEVYRDGWGIPHVFAKSVTGAFWGEGYTEAQDRLWQMETYRRGARGESAEIFGEKSVSGDIDRRRAGYTEAELRRMFEASGERMRAIMTAYASGVNAFIAEGKLPPGYAEHSMKPRPWSETDSLAIGVMMARRFGEAGAIELQIQQVWSILSKKLGEEKAGLILHDVMRDSDPYAPTTLNDHERGTAAPKDGRHNLAPPADPEWYAAFERELDAAREAREALGLPTYFGSNAWVVGPKKSATGRAMLYGGPMMGFNMPSICNEVHLVAPGLNVAGMSFPGVPGVMIGFNEKIAWTTTSGGADLVDIYVLELNPDNLDEYRWNGEWKRFETVEVEIRIAGAEPRKETVRRSRYGPLVGSIDRKNNRAYTQAMSFWMKEHTTFEGVMDFNFAASAAEFAKSVGKIVTSHNFFVADSEGHIGFWYCGAHPQRRKGHDQRLPQKGDGSMDWEGLLPFEKWPQAIDPEQGWFGNWNNKPSRAWEPSGFGRIFWGKKILDVLEGADKVTFGQVESLARDAAYHDFLADYFAPHILGCAKDAKDERVAKAVDLLSKYDRVQREGEPAPVMVRRWVEAMIARVFDEFGPFARERSLQRFLIDPLLYLLEGNGLIKFDFAEGADLKALGLEVLKEVVREGFDKLAWKCDEAEFKAGDWKLKGPRAGGRGTFQMSVEVGPDGPRATTLAAPGQSEDPEAPHACDQLFLFAAWKYKPFVFRRDEMK